MIIVILASWLVNLYSYCSHKEIILVIYVDEKFAPKSFNYWWPKKL